MPEMVHTYNPKMGGVDLFDQFVANYRIRIRSKKCWWPIFSWSIDAGVVNAWIMYKSIKRSSIFLLGFRRKVAQQALKQSGTFRRRPGLKIGYSESTADAIRFDRKDHWPVPLPTRYSRFRVCGGIS